MADSKKESTGDWPPIRPRARLLTLPPAAVTIDEEADTELHLIVLTGTSVGKLFTLGRGLTLIGRDERVDICLLDRQISRKHAAIRYDASSGFYELSDLQSRNGTTMNGCPVDEPRALCAGDKIVLGTHVVLRVSADEEAELQFARCMNEAALRDPLTGSYNRRYLMNRLDEEVAFARRHERPLALLLLDIDYFKKVNDTYGHPAGDEILRQVCSRVQETIRTEDVFCRYGGEEFSIISRDIASDGATVLAERVRKVVADAPYKTEAGEMAVTISVGVAVLTAPHSASAMIEAADQALYSAKAGGRNRIFRFGSVPGKGNQPNT